MRFRAAACVFVAAIGMGGGSSARHGRRRVSRLRVAGRHRALGANRGLRRLRGNLQPRPRLQ
jgi:hypothetical protein